MFTNFIPRTTILSIAFRKASTQRWCFIELRIHPYKLLNYSSCSSNIDHISFAAHYDDVIMTMLASQITSLTVVYSIVYSGVNQRKHQSSASLAFVREIHRGPVNFPHKWPVTRKMFPFDDVIMDDILPVIPKKSYHALNWFHKVTGYAQQIGITGNYTVSESTYQWFSTRLQ